MRRFKSEPVARVTQTQELIMATPNCCRTLEHRNAAGR